MHFERKTPNYLLNGRYTRKEGASRFGDARQDGRGRALSQIADDARSVASAVSGRQGNAGKIAGKEARKGSNPKSEQAFADLPVQLDESQLELLKKEFGINNGELTA
jgi:hypothetical protein